MVYDYLIEEWLFQIFARLSSIQCPTVNSLQLKAVPYDNWWRTVTPQTSYYPTTESHIVTNNRTHLWIETSLLVILHGKNTLAEQCKNTV